MNRRTFLVEAACASAVAMTAVARIPVVQVQAQPPAQPPAQPDAPDAGGFFRPRGWGVCVPPQEWAQHGAWVLDGVMALLHPARWHSWGIWPLTDALGRVPMVFSDRWFDRDATRQYLADNPGCEWLLFNEPDMPLSTMTPELAVEVTLEFIDMARETGTEWQWMAPNVTLDTTHDGLGWLTEYMSIMRRKKGIMRPASWGIHPYTCNNVTRLRQSMGKWWDWHAVWGSGAQTIITEVCAEDGSLQAHKDVMDECAAMLRRKEVAGVMWASAYKGTSDGVPWQHYHLTVLDHDAQTVTLSDLGRRWKELQ